MIYGLISFTADLVSESEKYKDTLTKGFLVGQVNSFARWILGLVFLVSVLMVIYGGYLYITAGLDEKNVEKAKKTLLYAVIGTIVALLSFAVVSFSRSFL